MLKIKLYLIFVASMLLLISCNSCSHIPINDQYKLNNLTSIDSVVKVESLYIVEHYVGEGSITFKMMSSSTGTSILNSDNGKYILTTGHTCNPQFGVPFGLKNVKVTQHTFVVDSDGKRHSTITVDFDAKLDMCILHSKSLATPNMAINMGDGPEVGDKAYNYAAPVGVFGEKTVPVLEGRYSGKLWGMALYTIPAIGGSSGSPIFDTQGEMIGMIHSVHSRFHHLSFSPHHPELLEYIKMNTPSRAPKGIRLVWTDIPKEKERKIYLDETQIKNYIEKLRNKDCECKGAECLSKCL
tara:strand:+ start:6082 stop:6972 length:891 start_codon:yes stop_codon:yes gene_type:complete